LTTAARPGPCSIEGQCFTWKRAVDYAIEGGGQR
jgi:hypothetical protein